MLASVDQLAQVLILKNIDRSNLERLQPHTHIATYRSGETVMQERDQLPQRLYVVWQGTLQVMRTSMAGKEIIFRMLNAGEIFAAPALVGDGIAPATVIAIADAEVLTIDRAALLQVIHQAPEVALQILAVYNQRLQQLHDRVHDLMAERAIVRLARLIQTAAQSNITAMSGGDQLNCRLPHAQIAHSIGITYEESVRLFKELKPILTYQRGGIIRIKDWQKLATIAAGESITAIESC